MTNATEHLANAKNYIARGEDFYRKAAEEIRAAMTEEPLTYEEVAERVGRSKKWVQTLVGWSRSGESTGTPWSEASGQVAQRHTRSVLRKAEPEQIAEQFLSDPAIRAKVSRAQDIAHRQTEQRSRKAEREALGDETYDGLHAQQNTHDAEAELFKARRALIEALRFLNAETTIDDPWREGFLSTLDDLEMKIAGLRTLLQGGSIDEELDKLLAEGV